MVNHGRISILCLFFKPFLAYIFSFMISTLPLLTISYPITLILKNISKETSAVNFKRIAFNKGFSFPLPSLYEKRPSFSLIFGSFEDVPVIIIRYLIFRNKTEDWCGQFLQSKLYSCFWSFCLRNEGLVISTTEISFQHIQSDQTKEYFSHSGHSVSVVEKAL